MKKTLVILFCLAAVVKAGNSTETSGKFLKRLRNTILKQIQASSAKLIASPQETSPAFAYNALLGFDPNKQVLQRKMTATTPENAVQYLYPQSGYDSNTITQIIANLKKVNPYTMLDESPMTFLKAGASHPGEMREVGQVERKVVYQEKLVTDPEEYRREGFRFKEKQTQPSEYADSLLRSTGNRDSNVFLVRNAPINSPSLNQIEKLPIFVPIPIYTTYNVPSYELQEFNQKVKEIKPVPIEFEVEAHEMKPVPVLVQREQDLIIPQPVPIGVKV